MLRDAGLSRRSALRLAGGAVVMVAGSAVLAACGAGGSAQTGGKGKGSSSSSTAAAPVKLTGSGLSFVKIGKKGQYTITTRGDDIWNQADTFTYLCTTTTAANATWTCKVDSLDNTNSWAKCGIMARATLDPASQYTLLCVTPGNGVKVQWRDTAGDSAAGNDNLDSSQTPPCWLKLVKQGTTWTGFMSTTGVPTASSESMQATYNVDMGKGKYYVGIAGCAHDNTVHGAAVVEALTGFTPTLAEAVGTNDTVA